MSESDKLKSRSSITNGSRLFAVTGINPKASTYRRFRDLVELMTNDLGGDDILSEFQKQLIRRAATLSVMAESTEADIVRDMTFDPMIYGTTTDRLRRLCETLGLRRVAREAVTLESYLGAKTIEGEAAE